MKEGGVLLSNPLKQGLYESNAKINNYLVCRLHIRLIEMYTHTYPSSFLLSQTYTYLQ